SSALKQVLRRSKPVLNSGRQLIIFPEGTRRKPGAPPQYKYGVAHIYGVNTVPCVPVALNSGLFWPRRSFMRRPGNLVVEFLDPIPPGMPQQEFYALLQERLEAASDALIAEAVAKDPRLAGALDTEGKQAAG
ncbi:MAG: 1-acyl-sn-glycerol-3-phosphate acyltransferase, partial [Beijerinckiaceae bacterium]|nr:1-acyl-sn-glycerol-3-phosphate acyltransferase [Beijerinckiaceae bacterium]